MGFHLQFIQKAHFLSWDELSCLARCNGFKGDLFEKHFRRKGKQLSGLTTAQFDALFESGKLERDLHKTVNFRTSAVNALALRKSMRLVRHKKLTFQEVYDAKVAFDLYDHEADHEGIFLKDLTSVSRALKLSGRIIAPSQLPVEIKRITRSTELPSRLQLHEFLELISHCPRTEDVRMAHAQTQSRSMNSRSIYELQDFKRILVPEEKRIENKLNAQKHWQSFKLKYNTARMIKKDVQERRHRLKAMRFQPSSDHADELAALVKESEHDVQRARLGKAMAHGSDRAKERQRRIKALVRGRPASAPVHASSARSGGSSTARRHPRAASHNVTRARAGDSSAQFREVGSSKASRPQSSHPATRAARRQRAQTAWERARGVHTRCKSASSSTRSGRWPGAERQAQDAIAGSDTAAPDAAGTAWNEATTHTPPYAHADTTSEMCDDVVEEAGRQEEEEHLHHQYQQQDVVAHGAGDDSHAAGANDLGNGSGATDGENGRQDLQQQQQPRKPHGDDWRNSRATELTFVQETLRELQLTPEDLLLEPQKHRPIIDPSSQVEQEALMEDLKWDLATGADPALRKLIREAIDIRPTTAPSRRISRTVSGSSGGVRALRVGSAPPRTAHRGPPRQRHGRSDEDMQQHTGERQSQDYGTQGREGNGGRREEEEGQDHQDQQVDGGKPSDWTGSKAHVQAWTQSDRDDGGRDNGEAVRHARKHAGRNGEVPPQSPLRTRVRGTESDAGVPSKRRVAPQLRVETSPDGSERRTLGASQPARARRTSTSSVGSVGSVGSMGSSASGGLSAETALLARRGQSGLSLSLGTPQPPPSSSTGTMLSAWSSASAMSRKTSFTDGGRVELRPAGSSRSPTATLPVRDWRKPGKWKRAD